ncbi:DUF4334 domain-containing protein [Nocardioides massiliensis]|uniref:DUF4334 domain-containing protein n=1 Tax=Nocardioides massiliensis TaxID=1325935 RepID=A0ABT9NPZ1_9ACTN|nr:DUF4334 domain-containing protein [Nocardioides massiliensis]MDP9822347.1 hypothetical protein [Nocardioides massiliensis]
MRFENLRSATHVEVADVEALWARCRTVGVEEVLGAWRGGDFAVGHPVSNLLTSARWHGKRFDSPTEAHPLICRDEHGELYSEKTMGGGGYASLWEVGFRGEVTATMVYDRLPVLDQFKAVDDNALLGVMNGKLERYFGSAELYWFWLERE